MEDLKEFADLYLRITEKDQEESKRREVKK